jgi:hypothetical protein
MNELLQDRKADDYSGQAAPLFRFVLTPMLYPPDPVSVELEKTV